MPNSNRQKTGDARASYCGGLSVVVHSRVLYVGTTVVGGALAAISVPDFQPSKRFASRIDRALATAIGRPCPHVLFSDDEFIAVSRPGVFCARCIPLDEVWTEDAVCDLCGRAHAVFFSYDVWATVRGVPGMPDTRGLTRIAGNLCRWCAYSEARLEVAT